MRYTNKQELQQTLRGFLRQRKKYYQDSKQVNLANLCWNLEVVFDQIREWDYWRQCLEVSNQSERLEMILPTATGGHKKIRAQMIGLINHAKNISSIPRRRYLTNRAFTSISREVNV